MFLSHSRVVLAVTSMFSITRLNQSRISIRNVTTSTNKGATISEVWESHRDIISDAEARQRQQWAFRIHGSYYNLINKLEKNRLHLFRRYQYASNVHQRQFNRSIVLNFSKNRYGYDGPGWKKYWIRRRRPK